MTIKKKFFRKSNVHFLAQWEGDSYQTPSSAFKEIVASSPSYAENQ